MEGIVWLVAAALVWIGVGFGGSRSPDATMQDAGSMITEEADGADRP